MEPAGKDQAVHPSTNIAKPCLTSWPLHKHVNIQLQDTINVIKVDDFLRNENIIK